MNTASIVQKLWNYCNVLRDDGMSYGDYVEQLTYLLFLKMADERSRPPYSQNSPVPAGYDWPSLTKKDGDELFDHYRHTLEELGKQKGLLGLIFTTSQNNFESRRFIAALSLRRLSASNLQWRLSGPGQAAAAAQGLGLADFANPGFAFVRKSKLAKPLRQARRLQSADQ